ncbi:MAG: hypothetical protein EAX96_13055 [Candidatus Lokiarchaeota archaeon]|nr:hypothetical protein [Candidatus Lokiarchaeota archaeon]
MLNVKKFLIYWRRKKYFKRILDKKGLNICTYCDQEVLLDAQFCMNHGKEVNKTTKMDNIIS